MRPLLSLLAALAWFTGSSQADELPGVNIFVAVDGDDENSGIIEEPKATIQGALDTLREFRYSGDITPDIPVNLWIRGGRYPHTSTISIDHRDSGAEGTPFRVSGWKDEKVFLDGRLLIERDSFQPVSQTPDASRLSGDARAKVLVATVDDSRAAGVLAQPGSQLSFGEQMMQVARFPDIGFTILDKVHKGDTTNAVGTREKPKGALLSFNPGVPAEWAGEINRSEKARLSGYISASWLKQSFVIASAQPDGKLRLRDGSSYGMPPKHICRAYLENVLPALDRPGEWFYDVATKQLFIWPPDAAPAEATIGVWAGPAVFMLGGCSYVTVENLTLENLGGQRNGAAAFSINSGSHNRIAGCTIRNVQAPMTALNITGGTNNGALSCDIYDLGNASRLSGGSNDHDSITHGENYIENCQFTQIYSTDFYGKVCGMSGAGNIFRNNLCHNHNGQIVTMSGVDHLVERNEVFNTGIEEGDGGSFYQGAMFFSWGNTFRHNFFHHIMCVPEMYPRAAIFSDDRDCGDVCYGNVFYKAGEGFKSNVGSGHQVYDNISIEGVNAVYIIGSRPDDSWRKCMSYLKGNPTSGDKDNIIGKGLRVMGKPGWESRVSPENWAEEISPFWYDRYPMLKTTVDHWMRKRSMEYLSDVRDNHAIGYGDRNPFSVPGYSLGKGNTTGKRLSSFNNPKALDFSYRGGRRPKWAPETHFAEVGLYQDDFRRVVPDKDAYRAEIYEHWKGERSAAPREYKVREVLRRSYLNTGLIVRKHTATK